MDDFQKYLDPKVLSRLSGLALRARLVVEGYVSGVHRSPFHGFSVEFAEHREYAPGDDLRYLDWKVFGRTDKFYLKQFEEETNLACHLLVDTSRSMTYRSPGAAMSKLDYAYCAAASLAYLILHQQDSVGLVTAGRGIRTLVRPSTNPSHMEQLITVMENTAPEPKTSLGPVFHELAGRFDKRGIVIVLSDLFDNVEAMVKGLKHLRHRRHEVVLMHVLDPAELEFTFELTTLFQGLEQTQQAVVEPRALRRAYLDEFNAYLHRLKYACRALRMDYVQLRTDRSLEVVLSSYLASRGRR